ncbi:MAG: ATP-binding protein [Rhodospirillaceae bacterium]|nr:ATP-binding protein [Rhodospirillales bacterium]
MTIKLGNKADGEDFFDRQTEREDLWRYVEGNHIVLSGPRRLGKTSLLQRLGEEAADKGLLARLVDVEGIDTPQAFIAELERAFPDSSVTGHLQAAGSKASEWLNRFRKVELKIPGGFGGGLELQAMPEAPWSEAAYRLQKRLSDVPALVLIDEFSVFLEKLLAHDPAEAERLLGWLRTWRQQSGIACRFLFSGSIGLNALLARYTLNTRFNDCYDFRLGPFRHSAAMAMLAEQSRREGWLADQDVFTHLCGRVGWLSPFYINLLLANTIEAARDRLLETDAKERRLQQTDVDDAYDRLLAVRSRFIHWYQRLERDLTEPHRSFTLAILSFVAKSDNGLTQRQLMARLQRLEPDPEQRASRLAGAMLLLEEDGYLGMEDDRICFLSFLLRDYWRRNYAR